MCVSCSVVFDSLRPHGLYSARLLYPWNSSGKNTGVGCHFLLQGIFPTQESNLGVSPALQADSLPLSCQGSYFQTDIRACKTENTVSFLLQKSCYLVTKLCLSIRLLCPWDFPGKNTEVSCHFLLQGSYMTQESNPCFLCLLH